MSAVQDALADLQSSENVRALVATVDGEPAARLVARVSPALRDDRGRPYGMLGSFEAVDGQEEAVGELFREAVGWLRGAGAGGPIVGPMDGDTWHRYRLNVGPFDEPPFLLEPHNPPYYERLWTDNGFAVLERYFSKRVDPAAVVAHLGARAGDAIAAGYTLRRLDLRSFEDELRILLNLSRRAFCGNFLYTDIRDDEFLALYAGMEAMIDPDLVWFARSPAGEDVGFLFAYPDRAVAAVDFKTIGVLPGHRRAGVAAALFHAGHRLAVEKGYQRANHCLYKEGNPSGDLDGGHGEVFREYRLYEWKG